MKSKIVFVLCICAFVALPTKSSPSGDLQARTESPSESPLPSAQQIPVPIHQHYSSAEVNAWGILFQVIERLDEYVGSKSLGSIHDDDMLLSSAANILITENRNHPSPRSDQVRNGLLALTRQAAALHAAGDAFDLARSKAELKNVRSAFSEAQKSYSTKLLDAARALAERYCCPMHPDVIGKKMSLCPKCGMPLDTQVRLSPFALPDGAKPAKIVSASVETDAPLQVGLKTNARLHLTTLGNQPVSPDQLREVHTKRIHLLLIDGSLTDYHHEHPVPTHTAGEYAFSFTPKKPGPYRVWADVQPYATGLQDYAMTMIPADKPSESLTDKADRFNASSDGLNYSVEFKQKVKAGEPVTGKLRVTKADGSGFTYLEPVMGAFAHLVAFHEDGFTIVHTHSKGTRQLMANDRGGPDFEFQFFAPKPGFYRLFAQVQFNRVQRFAPFGINVQP